jgi:hypothetical protein
MTPADSRAPVSFSSVAAKAESGPFVRSIRFTVSKDHPDAAASSRCPAMSVLVWGRKTGARLGERKKPGYAYVRFEWTSMSATMLFQSPVSQSRKYRPDIDGSRAVAVLPVVLYRAGYKAFSGGFVGVDIFVVISGFLITSILTEDIQSGPRLGWLSASGTTWGSIRTIESVFGLAARRTKASRSANWSGPRR